MKEGVTMSHIEIERIGIMERLIRGEIKHEQASQLMGLSIRQCKRLKKKYKEQGTEGIVHKSRGMPSNRRIKPQDVLSVMAEVRNTYHDFGPTLAHEKLHEKGLVSFSVERLRQAMIKEGIWKAKSRKMIKNHPLRTRRSCLGELIQLDGSPHKWFEDRGPGCSLIAYIDDATSKWLYAKFVNSESTWSYFETMKDYILKYGKPLALYSDKHGVFRINASKDGSAAASDSHGYTQFGRAMNDLNIGLIHANSPQAKGRVERLFGTLQDRLVKDLRLEGISNMAAGNKFLPTFLESYNKKFSVTPAEPTNMHRCLNAHENLDAIFTIQDERILSKTLTCQHENILYQIKTKQSAYILRHVKILVSQSQDKTVTINYKGKSLDYDIVLSQPKSIDAGAKELNHAVDAIKATVVSAKPSPTHPWRKFVINNKNTKERNLVYQQ